jgi:MarR family transcriptional regulator, lower aerobic nicotinate degradation pathway regulator
MIAEAPRRPIAPRATDRPGDVSPFALGLLLRRAHWRAAAVMSEALRPLGIELRHFAVLLVLVNRGPTEQRDLVEATGSDKAGVMRVVDDLERKGWPCASPFRGIGGYARSRSPLTAWTFSTPLTWPQGHWLSA